MADDTGLSPTDRDAMIRTVLTEARTNDPMGWAAVGSVIRNRLQAGSYGDTPTSIVRAPNQFEVWSNGRAQAVDPNSPQYAAAGRVVDAIAAGMPDPTGGMTHFYSPSGQAALGRAAPSWGRGPAGAAIGGQLFYAPQGAVQQQAPAEDAIAKATQPQQGQSVSEDPLSVLKRYGVTTGGSAPAVTAPVSSGNSTASTPAAEDPLAALARYGVKTEAAPAAQDQPGVRFQTPSAAQAAATYKPDGSATEKTAAATGGFLDGIPIAGPYIKDAGDRTAAAYLSLKYDKPFSQTYDLVRGISKSARDANPLTAAAGGVAGSIYGALPAVAAAPGAFGIGAGPIAGRALIGGVTGAGLGAADAAVRGQDPTGGAALGAVGGVAGPVLGRAIGAGVSGVSALLNPGVDNMGRPAVNILTQALSADSPAGVRAAADRLGPQAALPDLGPSFGGLAQGLGVKPGDAKTAIFNMLEDRAAGANGRITTDLNGLLGPARDPQAVTNDLVAARSAQDAQNYGAVHRQGAEVDPSAVVGLIDNRLQNATGAQRTALQSIRRELVVQEGQPATATNPAQAPVYRTSSEFLHNLRQEIDGVMDQNAPGLGVQPGALSRAQGTVGAVRNSLDQALKQQVPGMTEADAASADMARRIAAVQTGTGILGSGKTAITPTAFAEEYANMNPAAQQALTAGTRGEIDRLVGTAANDPAKLRSMLQGEGGWNTAKLSTIFGSPTANALVDAVAREGAFSNTMNKVVTNSQTASRTAAANLLKDTDPAQVNLMSMNTTGLAAQAGKKFVYDPIMSALMTPNNGPRDAQLGRALSLQGPARNALIDQLVSASQGAQRATSVSTGADRTSNLATNLLLQDYLRRKLIGDQGQSAQ